MAACRMCAPQPATEAKLRQALGELGTAECLMQQIEEVFDNKPAEYTEEHFRLFHDFKAALNSGAIRAAEPDPSTEPAGA